MSKKKEKIEENIDDLEFEKMMIKLVLTWMLLSGVTIGVVLKALEVPPEIEKIGKKVSKDYTYNKEDIPITYYVKTIDPFSNEITSYFVKKYNVNQQQEHIKEHTNKYLQKFNQSIPQNSNGNIILYLNVEDDGLISVEYNDEYSKKTTLINTVVKEISLYDCLLQFDVDKEVLTSDDLSELKELIDEKLIQKSTEKVLIK